MSGILESPEDNKRGNGQNITIIGLGARVRGHEGKELLELEEVNVPACALQRCEEIRYAKVQKPPSSSTSF